MPNALISCIVPVRNAERYLAAALDSILAQDYRPLQICVVDDGSTDGTRGVVARYADAGVLLLEQDRGGGAAGGRNAGMATTTGPFVAFLDGDDLWLPGKLSLQMSRFRARPDLEASVTHFENFWSDDTPAADRWFDTDRRPAVVAGFSPVTLLARRDLFDRIGPWDESQGHASNSEWFDRARRSGVDFDLLPDVLVRRRLHAANLSRRDARLSHDDHLNFVKAALDRRRARLATSDPSG